MIFHMLNQGFSNRQTEYVSQVDALKGDAINLPLRQVETDCGGSHLFLLFFNVSIYQLQLMFKSGKFCKASDPFRLLLLKQITRTCGWGNLLVTYLTMILGNICPGNRTSNLL